MITVLLQNLLFRHQLPGQLLPHWDLQLPLHSGQLPDQSASLRLLQNQSAHKLSLIHI